MEREPVVLAPEQSYEKVEKTVQVPGNVVEFHTEVQPKEHTVYQKININESQVQKRELEPIFKGIK